MGGTASPLPASVGAADVVAALPTISTSQRCTTTRWILSRTSPCGSAPASRNRIAQELGLGQLLRENFDYQPLELLRADTGMRAGILLANATQQATADVIAITLAPTDRIGRGHGVAATVENQPGEKSSGLQPRPA